MTTEPLHDAADRRRKRLVWVRTLRLGLPALAGVLVLAVAGQIAWRGVAGALSPAPAADPSVRMIRPVFSGEGHDGSHYLLTAVSGVRDAKDEKRILLEKPVITVTRNGQTDTHTTSGRGVYQEDDHTLRLMDNVQVEQAGGYNFATNDALIDTDTGKVMGQSAVKGGGPSGQVQSNGYAVSEKGDRMVFTGRVHAQIHGK